MNDTRTLAVGIVTTEGREEYLDATLASVGDEHIVVFKDLQKGALRNKIASWQMLYETGADWLMLIEDDVLAARNWRNTAHAFMHTFPKASMIQLFSARKDVVKHAEKGWFLMPVRSWVGEQALMIPRGVWAIFYADFMDGTYKNYCTDERGRELYFDYVFRRYFMNYGHKGVVTSAPTVFEHVGYVSTFGHAWKMAGNERKSRLFLGEDADSYEYFSERLLK